MSTPYSKYSQRQNRLHPSCLIPKIFTEIEPTDFIQHVVMGNCLVNNAPDYGNNQVYTDQWNFNQHGFCLWIYFTLKKCKEILNMLNKKFATVAVPGQDISTDEIMITYSGRSTMKQYMPLKPVSRGFKCWATSCPNSSYTHLVEPYTGKEGDQATKRLGGRVLEDMSARIPSNHKGHIVHADRYFSCGVCD